MFEFLSRPDFKKRKVKLRFGEDIEPHETFLDSLARKKEEEVGVSEKKFEKLLSRNISKGLLIFVVILNSLLFIRTFQFQVIEGKNFSKLSERNKFTIYQIKAERGVIYDSKGNQLVWNKPSFDLVVDKRNLPQPEAEKMEILKEVSGIINKDFNELKKQIEESDYSELLVFENIPRDTLILLEARIGDLAGFKIQNNTARDYRLGSAFSHLIGYTGKIKSEELKANPEQYSLFDWVGRSGIEKAYEEVLRKNPGKLQLEKDAVGNIVSQKIISLPESGESLVLWLDSDLQKKLREELQRQIELLGAKKGAAVALSPKTGGVLSLVSLPDFDPNLFQKGSDPEALKNVLEDSKEPLLDRVISGRYLTGSTIKPLIASAALEEQIIAPDKKINDDKGYILIPNPWNPSSPTIKKDWIIHGWTDLRKAIAESCNVYFYTIGGGFGVQAGLGPTRIKQYLELFGWNEATGIDLPGETKGFLPDKEWKKKTWKTSWSDGDTYNFSIGQGFLQITPLEVVNSFVAVANGGTLFRPQIAKEIIGENKEIIQEIKPEIIRQNFISPENLQIVREGMRQAVTGVNSPQASSVILNSLPVSAAAKTGTAELGNDRFNNWVTVFAPYEDPEIVLTIMIENVKGVQAAVLPVAREVLNWYFAK